MLNFKMIETLKPNSLLLMLLNAMTIKQKMVKLKFLRTQT